MSNYIKSWKDQIANVRTFVKNRIAWINEYTSNGYVYYGVNDELPNEIIEAINNSGTATACSNKLKQFIEANGFKDEYTNQFKINKNQSFDGLLSEIVENDVKLEGFALRLFFNRSGLISHIKNVPITWIRRIDDDTFAVNRLMGEQGKRESETLKITEFDPTEDPNQRLARVREETRKNKGKQVGELFYCFRPKLGRNYDMYPVPSFYSGIDDIISDGKISTLELRNIQQGWRTPIIISTGPIDNENEILDEDGNGTNLTQLDLFNERIEEFLGEEAAPVLHLMGRTEEEKPTVTTIDIKELVDMTEKSTIRVGEKVCRLMGVPKILVSFSQAGQLGNVQELKNTMDLFYISILNRQNFISQKLNILRPFIFNGEGLDFEISKLNALTLIPDSVVSRLSESEINELFEIPTPKVENEIEDEELASRFSEFGVGGVQGILGVQQSVSDGTVSFDAAVEVLKVIYGFTEDQIRIMLGGAVNDLGDLVVNENSDEKVNNTLTNLTGRQMQNVQRIIRKFNKGELTYEQAGMMLSDGFGFTDEQVSLWLVTQEEEDGNDNA